MGSESSEASRKNGMSGEKQSSTREQAVARNGLHFSALLRLRTTTGRPPDVPHSGRKTSGGRPPAHPSYRRVRNPINVHRTSGGYRSCSIMLGMSAAPAQLFSFIGPSLRLSLPFFAPLLDQSRSPTAHASCGSAERVRSTSTTTHAHTHTRATHK